MDTEELRNRVRAALRLLSDGQAFKVGDLTFAFKDTTHFLVSGWTNNNRLENVTRQSALTELKEIKSLFLKMVDSSSELSDFIKDKEIEYCLSYDDYGKGGIGICREKFGQIIWETELPE